MEQVLSYYFRTKAQIIHQLYPQKTKNNSKSLGYEIK